MIRFGPDPANKQSHGFHEGQFPEELPARYSLYVARFMEGSHGLTSDDATHAQHVRAEFYVPGYGWIPVDPSDVRRTIALEGLSDRDSKLLSLRKILFGVWEMNWIAFNLGTDIVLPGQNSPIPFLLLPQLESSGSSTAGVPYSIRTRQVEL